MPLFKKYFCNIKNNCIFVGMENEIKHITMSFTGRYGHFYLDGVVNGEKIRVVTTDSEAFDWYNDDSNVEKHLEAVQYCKSQLIEAYQNKFNN